jgi:hypothetical protein
MVRATMPNVRQVRIMLERDNYCGSSVRNLGFVLNSVIRIMVCTSAYNTCNELKLTNSGFTFVYSYSKIL